MSELNEQEQAIMKRTLLNSVEIVDKLSDRVRAHSVTLQGTPKRYLDRWATEVATLEARLESAEKKDEEWKYFALQIKDALDLAADQIDGARGKMRHLLKESSHE